LIVFLLRHRHSELDTPTPVPVESEFAEPMRRALRGESGTVVGPDYRGAVVLASYEPVAGLDLGIVAKIDLAEVRAPFLRAGGLALLAALVLIGIGSLLFRSIIEPLAREVWTSERKYRSLFERSVAAIVVTDPAGVIVEGNHALYELLGYERGELQGTSMATLYVDAARRQELTKAVAAAGFVKDFHAKLRCKNGTEVDCLLTATARLGTNGEILGYETIIRDVTEQKRLEELFRYQATMLSSMADSVITTDADFTITSWNLAAERMFGRRADEVLGKTLVDVADIEYQNTTREEALAAIRELGFWSGELVHINRDGRRIPLMTVGTLVKDEVGEPLGVVAVHRDISERVRIEQELRDTEREVRALAERTQAILHAVPDIIVEVDRELVYTWVNEPALEFFGHDVLGKEAANYFVGQQDTYERVRPLFNGDPGLVYVESMQRRKDGAERLLAWTCRDLKDEKGDVIGALISARDITEQRSVEGEVRKLNAELETRVALRTRELRTANKELETYAYSVSHDLKAPLRAIIGFSEIIADRYSASLDEAGQRYFEYIHRAGMRMTLLIEDLLRYSRLGLASLEIEPLKLDDVLSAILETRTDELQEGGVVVEVPDDLPAVHGSPALLTQIFDNLLGNALRYHRPGVPPKISIGWSQQEDRVAVTVSDNGIGIPVEFQEKVFDIFQRFHSDEEYPGTGIGFAMVQKAVEMLGGAVSLHSTVDQGSTFTVQLPAALPEEFAGRLSEVYAGVSDG